MAKGPDPTPADLARDNIAGILRNRTTLEREQIQKLAETFCDPFQPCTLTMVQQITGVTRTTARKYRNMILAALERPASELADERAPAPSSETLIRVQQAAAATANVNREEAINRRLAKQGIFSSDSMDAAEVVRIIDRQIRKLDNDPQSSAAALKQLLQLKIDFQALQGVAAEQPIDPRKVLGPDGLRAMERVLGERVRLALSHRREMPLFYESLLLAIADSAAEDLASEDGFAKEALFRLYRGFDLVVRPKVIETPQHEPKVGSDV